MSLPSFYGGSPEDEIELFRLVSPDNLPKAEDETVLTRQEESLASPDYDDRQAQTDEDADANRQESLSQSAGELISLISELSTENLDALMRLVQEVLDGQDDSARSG